MLTHQENELLTSTRPGTPMGTLMRRYWIPALFPPQLPEPDCPPLRVRLLNEDLVAFRASDGSVGLLEEHCAHRGASLFFGRNEECGLRCVYHGWKFDLSGHCVDMPSEPPESTFKEHIQLTAYPCRERGGVIWTFMGPPEIQPELPDLEWAMLPESHRYASKRLQECNWLQAMEGGFDSSHVPFLHRGDQPNVGPRRTSPGFTRRYELVPTDYGFMVGSGRDQGDGTTYWNVNHCILPFYKTVAQFAGDEVPIAAHAWVPVDDESCLTWSFEYHPQRPLTDEEVASCESWRWVHAQTLPGSDRTVLNKSNDYMIDRARQRSGASYTGIYGVGMQDSAIQESMRSVQDRTREHLGTSDVAIITIRRYLLQALKELQAESGPPAPKAVSQRVRSFGFQIPTGASFQDGLDAYLREQASCPTTDAPVPVGALAEARA